MTIGGAVLAFFLFAFGLVEDSAPKQAAAAGLALCMAVIPYVVARSFSELAKLPPPTKKNKFDLDEEDLHY